MNSSDQMETSIAINHLNNSFLIAGWNDYRYSAEGKPPVSGYSFSIDGGITWTTPDTLWVPSYRYGIDPSVAFDSFGNAYFCYIAGTGVPPGGWVYVAKTANLGEAWTYHQVDDAQNQFYDKSYMTIDNTDGTSSYKGRIYVTWSALSPNTYPIKFAYSPDYNMNFTTISEPIDEITPYTSELVVGSVPAIGPSGEVYAVWMYTSNRTQQGASGEIRIRKSINGGESFGNFVVITTISSAYKYTFGKCRISSIPTIAIDQNTGRVYVAWTEYNGGDCRIYFSYSDNGQNWSTKQMATDKTSDKQFFPWLTVDPKGIVGLAYTHGFYQNSEPRVDIYLAESFDEGENTYSPNLRVTEISSNPDDAQERTNDYLGIDSRMGSYAHVLWTDFRNGNPDIYTSKVDLLMPIAIENKSTDYSASYSNNTRSIAKGRNNSFHEVFTSGGEIFYRKGTLTGGGNPSWQLTKRISSANDNNRLPCITLTPEEQNNDWVHVVWSQKLGTNIYKIWYCRSTDSGITWDEADILPGAAKVTVSSSQSIGPQPVIAGIVHNPLPGETNYKLVAAFCTKDGLRYRISTDPNGSWTTPYPDLILSDQGRPNYRVWFPSIMGYDNYAFLTYDYRSSYGVYSRKYYGASWSSETRASENIGTIQDRHSQVAINPYGNPVASWCAQRWGDPDYRIVFRHGFADNTWGWYEEFPPIDGIHSYYPAITSYSRNGNYGIAIDYHTSDKQIKMKKYMYTYWDEYTLSTNGRFADITHEDFTSGVPKMIWTDQSGSPYEIMLSSQNLPKSQVLTNLTNHRRVGITNQADNTALAFEIGEVMVSNEIGEVFSVDFPIVDIRQRLNLNTIEDALYYLIPDTVLFTENVSQLKLTQIIYTTSPYDSVGSKPGTEFKDFDVELTLQNLIKGDSLSFTEHFSNDDGKFNLEQEKIFDIATLAGQTVVLKHKLHNLKIDEKNLIYGVGNVWLKKKGIPKSPPEPLVAVHQPLPENYQLSQNFPNPFNPETEISYQLPEATQVTIVIYNMRGQKIRTLADRVQPVGCYVVRWNGRDETGTAVASGVYFYMLRAGQFNDMKKMILLR